MVSAEAFFNSLSKRVTRARHTVFLNIGRLEIIDLTPESRTGAPTEKRMPDRVRRTARTILEIIALLAATFFAIRAFPFAAVLLAAAVYAAERFALHRTFKTALRDAALTLAAVTLATIIAVKVFP